MAQTPDTKSENWGGMGMGIFGIIPTPDSHPSFASVNSDALTRGYHISCFKQIGTWVGGVWYQNKAVLAFVFDLQITIPLLIHANIKWQNHAVGKRCKTCDFRLFCIKLVEKQIHPLVSITKKAHVTAALFTFSNFKIALSKEPTTKMKNFIPDNARLLF